MAASDFPHGKSDAACASIQTLSGTAFASPSAPASPAQSDPGTLYMVAVPIGCMEDLSVRALRVLREVRLIICENTAVFRPLAEHFALPASLINCKHLPTKHLPTKRASANHTLTDRILTDRPDADWIAGLLVGHSVAFVCDAGTPAIADPGRRLVRAALKHHIPVCAIPGPAAVLVALVASGLSANRFVFDGFPPRDLEARARFFQSLARQQRTTVLYESASGLRATLRALRQTLGPHRRAAIACRLTQPAETWVRGTVGEVDAHFQRHRPRGEYTLVVEGARQKGRANAGQNDPVSTEHT